MPYGRYGGYGQYGADPSDLMQASGNNPFYNPYSKHPNWGGGISDIIKQFMMMKMMKDKQKQEALDREHNWANQETANYYTGRELDIREKALNQPKALTGEEQDRQDRIAYGMRRVRSGEWNINQALDYRDTAKMPTDEKERQKQIFEESKNRAAGTIAGGGGTNAEPTAYQRSTQDRLERQTVLSSIENSLKDISDTFKSGAKGETSALIGGVDYKSLGKSRSELNRYKAKLLGKKNLTESEVNEATRIMSDPSKAFPTKPIQDVGGVVGQQLGPTISGKDQYGYAVGETKQAKGATWEYIGNNQWRKK